MVEAAPASPLEVAKADLLFEFVVVALNAPAQLGGVDQLTESNVRRKRREPIFGGCFLALRPLDQQPFLRPALSEPVISMCRTDAHTGKARGQAFCRTLTPRDLAPSVRWQANRKLLGRDRSMLAFTPQQLRRSPPPRPLLRRPRPSSRRPYRCLWQDASHIAQAKCGDIPTQIGVGAIASIHQYHAARQVRRTGPAQMIQCNCRLGLEGDLLGYTGLPATYTVRRPLRWQIETIGHWQARMMICKRKGHSDLTIVLLAQLAAILPRNPN